MVTVLATRLEHTHRAGDLASGGAPRTDHVQSRYTVLYTGAPDAQTGAASWRRAGGRHKRCSRAHPRQGRHHHPLESQLARRHIEASSTGVGPVDAGRTRDAHGGGGCSGARTSTSVALVACSARATSGRPPNICARKQWKMSMRSRKWHSVCEMEPGAKFERGARGSTDLVVIVDNKCGRCRPPKAATSKSQLAHGGWQQDFSRDRAATEGGKSCAACDTLKELEHAWTTDSAAGGGLRDSSLEHRARGGAFPRSGVAILLTRTRGG